ncbi:hypothetical protein D8B26_004269 [Coccidioides posadasii str. Silveira]|uniref:Uncharacterized protein n=2 Tax=Coccidioides posadasii TaxID=199306 RepID=E9DCL2_COCPS|nr:conserved hypothetical protein [Coccidioides posadasii str. Silveira]KMM69249.1 hypothetical protein CPAG_05570 [Coccidioides posadasii RMSCC 3488]QVM09614.1 hypothetical protein D8B26_004269 [Coccidioides posadasii str. Silveira]
MAQEFTPDAGIDFALETPRVLHKLQSLTALARFEFEAGKGNEGTKILMVEWEDDDVTRSPVGLWHVSWDKKRTVLPADDRTNDHVRRCYFLLPPGATVPPVITLTYEPPPNSAETVKKNGDSIQINPLPAIFSPELGATARTAGKKGVLHTIWAKKRLQVLDKEIREESQHNSEGVALAMALQEKEWIEANFGVVARPAMPALNVSTNIGSVPLSPRTPLSPGGSKLSEKLKGLRLETSEKDLARRVTANPPAPSDTNADLHPLSPDEPDVAISSFNSFANTPVHFSPQQQQQQQPPPLAKAISLVPPASIQDQQSQLNTFASVSMHPIHNFKNGSFSGAAEIDSGEGLFAKALSPRSPDIPRSPFSFSPEETLPYAMKASR